MSLVSLRVLCYSLGQGRQAGQQGRQSYADHIEGLHYLEASYFLFSLKGRVRESISLAKEGDGERKGGKVKEGEVQEKKEE